jgi:glucosamine--fructose-6-phosphate aminotransferase (isomerizing)
MCGIVGILGKGPVAPQIVDALKRLEYRGYDSAGVATLEEGALTRRRASGKLVNLEARLKAAPLSGRAGIGHTRWATHGKPTEANAHPHATDRVAIVHNGIIENFQTLKREILAGGRTLASETDTEIVAHLITMALDRGLKPVEAMADTLKRLDGAFALAVLFAGEEDLLVAARRGSPLAIGHGEGEMFLGSDAIALAPFTQAITYLEDGDWAVVTRRSVQIFNDAGKAVERPIVHAVAASLTVDKGNHRHFMQKEIYEQPEVISHTLAHYIDFATGLTALPEGGAIDFRNLPRLALSACGTASYAAHIGKYWFERLARLPVEVDIASEFRYRAPEMAPGGLALFISQSGETADTLAALKWAKAQGQHIAVVVNSTESSMAREADVVLPTLAGPEIGVASTKAFTTQLTVLACFAIAMARARGAIDKAEEAALSTALTEVPARAAQVLEHDEAIQAIAHRLLEAHDVLYLGRGTSYPLALEGALKLKEISYIHAEGYAAGEMKHGPIALIDENVPIIVLAPRDELFEKTASNVQEVMARGGKVIMISDETGLATVGDRLFAGIPIPPCNAFAAPVLYSIPIQLLAYHIAVLKGTDVDQPRNLAKSVTVE